MNYIKLLNAFNDLMRTEALPAAAQVLYYKILDIWNRSGRREWVSVPNQRLMVESVIRDEKTLIRHRDKLISLNIIDFKSGKKGQPSRYCIKKIYWDNSSEYDSTNDSECASVYDSTNASINPRHNRDRVRVKDYSPDAHEDEATVKVLQDYADKITLTPSPTERDYVSECASVYGSEMVLKAIDRFKSRDLKITGIRAAKYIGGILRDWQKNGYDEVNNNAANKKYSGRKSAQKRNSEATPDQWKSISGWG